MAPSKGKKQAVLQHELNSNEAFEKYLATDGLKVVDAYSEWCGPCSALQGTFKRIKTEIGDPLLSFAVAETDTIDALEKYRKKSKPTFLFYGKNVLVNVIRGANSPKIESAIKELLEAEHNAIDSGTERQVFLDTALVVKEIDENEPSDTAAATDELTTPTTSYTLLLIKPQTSAVESDVDEIFAAVAEAGFKVAAQEDVELDADKAKIVFADQEGHDKYEDLVTTCTSGPCKVLVLSTADTDGDCADLFSKLFDEPEVISTEATDDTVPQSNEGDESADVAAQEDLEGAATTVSVLAMKHATNVYYSTSTASAKTQIRALLEDFAKDAFADPDPEEEKAGESIAVGEQDGEDNDLEDSKDTIEGVTADNGDGGGSDTAPAEAADTTADMTTEIAKPQSGEDVPPQDNGPADSKHDTASSDGGKTKDEPAETTEEPTAEPKEEPDEETKPTTEENTTDTPSASPTVDANNATSEVTKPDADAQNEGATVETTA